MMRMLSFRRALLLALLSLLMTGRWPALAVDEWYTVQAGDSIQSIADHFGVTETSLIERNNLRADERLSRGQILRIPLIDDQPITHVVGAEDSLQAIAAGYGITVEALMAENNILSESHLIPGQTLHIPETARDEFTTTHTVQAGETLQKIGDRYGVDWRILADFNGIANPNRIYVGQELAVPSAAQITALPTPAPTATPFVPQTRMAPRIYVARTGDTLVSIAQRYAVPLDALREINGIRGEFLLYRGDILLIPPGNIADAGVVATPAAGERQHVVRPGETLGAIAALYGRDMWDIAAANGILNPNLVYVSQVLIIR